MLEVQDLVTRYGPVTALDRVGFTLETGTITAVLGANGAGKTSLLRTISGLVRPESGHVRFDGDYITKAQVEDIVRRGMAHVPEGRGVIAELTIEENLRLGIMGAARSGRDAPVTVLRAPTSCSPCSVNDRAPRRTCCPAVNARCS
jgi:branched-chain amino acid transport system ATP-binding protein